MKPLRVLSLGAGVQSSTVAMMMKHGEIEPADVAIFADTCAESRRTYEWVEWLRQNIGMPLIVVKEGTGLTAALEEACGNPVCTRCAQPPLYTDTGAMRERWCTREFKLQPIRKEVNRQRVATPPLFTENGTGVLLRQCTSEYKLAPIRREVNARRAADVPWETCGEVTGTLVVRRPVIQIMGISADEKRRMGYPDVQYITNEYPLCGFETTRHGREKNDVDAHQIESPVMGRADCIRWMVTHGYPIPPRSACVYCPYRCNEEWVKMRDLSPADWEEACRMDEMMRHGLPGTNEACYVHRSLKPLRVAPIENQGHTTENLFEHDCEGMCGV
jgi:hypothetical protein